MSDRVLLKACGTCALLGAAALIGGSVVSAYFGLGGENLPCRDGEQLLFLYDRRAGYLTRETLFLLYAIFALPEGFGVYLLLRRGGPFVRGALIAWLSGL